MIKAIVFFALVMVAFASPVPEAKADPKADPQLLAAAVSAPLVAAPLAAAPVAYSAPLTYPGYYAPSVYSAGYAYAPYASYIL